MAAGYAYQIDDDYTIDIPKRKRSIISFLAKLRNACILFLVLLIAYTA